MHNAQQIRFLNSSLSLGEAYYVIISSSLSGTGDVISVQPRPETVNLFKNLVMKNRTEKRFGGHWWHNGSGSWLCYVMSLSSTGGRALFLFPFLLTQWPWATQMFHLILWRVCTSLCTYQCTAGGGGLGQFSLWLFHSLNSHHKWQQTWRGNRV